MNAYETLLKQIENKSLANLQIALMAIAYWMIEAPGMKDSHLEDIMYRLGYKFDIDNQILSDGTNTFTIYQMLENTISSIYTTSNLTGATLKLVIKKAYRKSYITKDQLQALLNSLSTAEA